LAAGRRTFPPFRFNEDAAMDFVKRTIDLAMKNGSRACGWG